MKRRIKKRLYKALAVMSVLFVCVYFLQHIWAHRYGMAEHAECIELLGWFTMEERVAKEYAVIPTQMRAGDILVTLSTHSLGWRHGHVGLVLDESSMLECVTVGENSRIVKIKHWGTYANYAVLRVKGATKEEGQEVADYAKEHLHGRPYQLTAGLLGEKAPNAEEDRFGLQCAYLAWYAWNQFGIDLDGDGGRLVTGRDLLDSDKVEMVESVGMDFTL